MYPFRPNQFSLVVIACTILCGAVSNASVCWKSTYGRGVGIIPGTCKPHQSKSGLLCYPDCKPGYYNIAGVCWQRCKEGYNDTGVDCLKPASYGRGAGYPIWDKGRCEHDNPPFKKYMYVNPQHPQLVEGGGCEQNGLLWYPRCKAGFHAVGCCVCSPDCWPGTTDIGVSCQKDSYVVPPITPNCGKQVYDTGLCYNKCNTGFYGVGPVCWGQCPKDKPVDCGAMCGTSVSDCASAIGDMVLSVGQVVAKVAETIATLGTATSIEAATDMVTQSAVSALKSAVKKAVSTGLKVGSGAIVNELQKQGLPPDVAGKLASMTTNPETFDYQGFLKGLDPTGIVKVVDAFNKQICPTPPPAPGEIIPLEVVKQMPEKLPPGFKPTAYNPRPGIFVAPPPPKGSTFIMPK